MSFEKTHHIRSLRRIGLRVRSLVIVPKIVKSNVINFSKLREKCLIHFMGRKKSRGDFLTGFKFDLCLSRVQR